MSFELKVALWIYEKKSSDESIHSERQGPISVQSTSGDLTCQNDKVIYCL